MTETLNRVCGWSLIGLSLAALLSVLSGYLPGHGPSPDEGTAAHIFQLAVVALAPTIVAFLATADWTQPVRQARRLAIPGAAVALAFVALYYLEHVYYRTAHF